MKLLGFLNLGNTCYLNSVLQCFVNDPLFQEIVNIEQNIDLLNDLKLIISKIDLTDPEKQVSFSCNVNLIKYFPTFTRFQQHDAHEFLVTFLDTLKSPKLYHGETVNKIICTCCNTQKLIHEDFNTLNLSCSNSVVQSLEEYLRSETHDDPDNLYFCETCNKNTITTKKLFLNVLPKRLILVLKRYTIGSKNNNLIDYPFDMLIRETKSGDIKNYNLVSVIHHIGGLSGGHYTCNNKINDIWFFMDDELIQIDENLKCDLNAYILIYAQA